MITDAMMKVIQSTADDGALGKVGRMDVFTELMRVSSAVDILEDAGFDLDGDIATIRNVIARIHAVWKTIPEDYLFERVKRAMIESTRAWLVEVFESYPEVDEVVSALRKAEGDLLV